jgi:hypothetical protein
MDSRYSETGTSASSASDDLLRCIYIERLQRLTDLRSDPDTFECSETKQLVNFATYSTYRDCVELGMRTIARRILGLPIE